MKIISLVIGVLFLLFAGVQYNDPDPWLWIAFYGSVGIMGILATLNKHFKVIVLVLLGLGAAWSVSLFSGFLVFLSSGETLISEMSNDQYYIEEAREFLGLIMALAALTFLFFQAKKSQ